MQVVGLVVQQSPDQQHPDLQWLHQSTYNHVGVVAVGVYGSPEVGGWVGALWVEAPGVGGQQEVGGGRKAAATPGSSYWQGSCALWDSIDGNQEGVDVDRTSPALASPRESACHTLYGLLPSSHYYWYVLQFI